MVSGGGKKRKNNDFGQLHSFPVLSGAVVYKAFGA